MNPDYLRAVADHLWQSTLFTGVAGLLTLALRENRARVRHWLWLTASCKFLIPLSVLVALGGQLAWRTTPPRTQSGLSVVIEEVSQPFTAPPISAALLSPPAPAARTSVPAVLLGVWICGFVGIAFSWWIRWRRILATVRSGSPVQLAISIPARSSPTLLEPGVFGIHRPVLLLPEGICEKLTPRQLQAVIAHELCHIRYRDNLIAAIHMLVETVFWFHPLVWWIGKQMVEERERACDEEVLLLGSEPQVYAEGILNICKLYVESRLVCVSGVSGANLRMRIAAIMTNRAAVKLSFAKKAALTAAGTAALALPVILGMINAPAIRAQSSSSGNSARVASPKFEVVSIKPCKSSDPFPGGRGGGSGPSPGRLHLECANVGNVIKRAYLQFPNGEKDGQMPSRPADKVLGIPLWIDSDHYTIDAKTETPQPSAVLLGPMMQGLLEDRFKLRIHRETRVLPVYELRVAKAGVTLPPAKGGNCLVVDSDNPPPPLPEPGQPMPAICGGFHGRYMYSTTMRGLGQQLSFRTDRDVVDKTGLAGTFDLDFGRSPDLVSPIPEEGFPGLRNPNDRVSAFYLDSLSRLGLKLVPAKGPTTVMVIDHIERPSGN